MKQGNNRGASLGHHIYIAAIWISFLLAVGCETNKNDGQLGSGGEVAGAMGGESTSGTSGGEMEGGDRPGGMTGMASCMVDADCPPGTLCDAEQQACRTACERNSECGPSAICQDRFCLDLESCEGGVGGSCAEGSICDCQGVCHPVIGAPCQGDLQCQVDEFCDPCQGQCLPRSAPCEACRESVGCERRGDLCAPVGERGELYCLRKCTGQGTCDNLGAGYLCQAVGEQGDFCLPEAGECTALTECERDADCSSGYFCNDRLQCQPGCVDDTSCSEGLICQGLRCAPLCTSSDDCIAEGAVCDENGRCGIPGGCQSSRDCQEPETYCDLNTLRCVDGCQIDDDCLNANQECVAGGCRPRGCSRNYQCAFGQVCNVETSECVMAEGRHCESGCDPMAAATSCGTEGQRCLSLQDEEENPLGDFCFEPCEPEPNACPQGYTCQTIEDPSAGPLSLCISRCDLNP